MEAQEAIRLRIYISEKDKHDGMNLSDWIVRKAREVGLSGATVLRGIEGFGTHSKIHSTRMIDLSDNLPLIVELIDSQENINRLLPILDATIVEGLSTTEPIIVRKYRSENKTK